MARTDYGWCNIQARCEQAACARCDGCAGKNSPTGSGYVMFGCSILLVAGGYPARFVRAIPTRPIRPETISQTAGGTGIGV
jgi:hypothetical protein